MNSRPANTYPNAYPDACIDQVLTALRITEPPTGLEQRIAARLAQAAEARAISTSPSAAAPSYFAVILNAVKNPRIPLAPAPRRVAAATALTLLIALTTFAFGIFHHRPATNTAANRLPRPLQPSRAISSCHLPPSRSRSHHLHS